MLIIKTFIYISIMSIVTANNEFEIFEAAKQAKINIVLISRLDPKLEFL